MKSLAEKFGFAQPGRVVEGVPQRKAVRTEPKGVQESWYSASVFPSGDFSVGIVPPLKVLARDKEYERQHGDITERWVTWNENEQTFSEPYLVCKPTPVPPNLVSGSNLSQSGKPHGQKGITGFGKKMVRSAALLLQEEWGLACTGFGTLTIPPMSAEQELHVCANWNIAMKRFFECLRRHFLRRHLDPRNCWVTEIQEKRWNERGEVGLHCHFIYKAKNYRGGGFLLSADWVRETWHRVLCNLLADVCADIATPRVQLQMVKKSASGYLGKYMSKGGQICELIQAAGYKGYLPKRWWGMDVSSRGLVKRRTIKSTSNFAEHLFRASGQSSGSDFIHCSFPATYTSEARGEVVCGYYGRVDYWYCYNLQKELDMHVTT